MPKEVMHSKVRKAGGITSANAKAHVAELYRNTRSITRKPNTKLGGREMDPTKIPGFKYGKGTE